MDELRLIFKRLADTLDNFANDPINAWPQWREGEVPTDEEAGALTLAREYITNLSVISHHIACENPQVKEIIRKSLKKQ